MGIAALSVLAIYCIWRVYRQERRRRVALLHERVALMLWTTAGAAEFACANYRFDEVGVS
jgi:hypothetical protein